MAFSVCVDCGQHKYIKTIVKGSFYTCSDCFILWTGKNRTNQTTAQILYNV